MKKTKIKMMRNKTNTHNPERNSRNKEREIEREKEKKRETKKVREPPSSGRIRVVPTPRRL